MSTTAPAPKTPQLSREIGLMNLTLSQPLYIMGLFWIGVAAKLGPSHVAFWLAAMALFYLPSGAAVIYLNQVHPVEGGLYEWARLGLGDFVGFLVGWNMWLNCVAILSYAGVQVATMSAYALGQQWAWIGENQWSVALITVVLMASLVAIAMAGMKTAKWAHYLGGASC